ncbi:MULTISPECIES: PadR family transcriptional regulator [Paenibacillus]|uniref:PadR family transcriptional regulator n=1 Tax=Paenibacillus lautus TaxID=1401 RepID=A0A1R1AZG2_PAELA|nr:PadR family transcriptional regulator [Paenibacillus lautus]OME91434.1 PadR family transcriptional regulator [Paenibacillus lautus]
MTNLILLSFLRQRPMHGYEIQQLIQASRMDLWTNILSGSIYYALNKMESDGLIAATAEERTGARLRKIYSITDEGEKLFQKMIRETLTLPPHTVKSDFSLGLVWIENIPKQEAVELLQQNRKQVEESLAQWRSGKEIKGQYGLSKIALATFDNAISSLEQDIAFLNKIITLVQE